MGEKKEITYAFPKDKRIDPSCYIDAYNLILQCSQFNSPRGFAIGLVELLKRVCPYDYAMVFFLDANRKVSGRYSVGIDERWLEMYLEYYMKLTEYPSDLNMYQDVKENSNFEFEKIIRWKDLPKSEFTQDYIQELGICYSWGFTFFDLNGDYRVIFSLDRTRDEPFSTIEQDRLRLALPILNNIHRNFFYQSTDTDKGMLQSPWRRYNLTKREIEIANLLCQGMSVKNISSALYIAVTTTYKHIAHIYEKVGVSTQQELLVKALNKKE